MVRGSKRGEMILVGSLNEEVIRELWLLKQQIAVFIAPDSNICSPFARLAALFFSGLMAVDGLWHRCRPQDMAPTRPVQR